MQKFYDYDIDHPFDVNDEKQVISNGMIRLNYIPQIGSIKIGGFVESTDANVSGKKFFIDYSVNTKYRMATGIVLFSDEYEGEEVTINYKGVSTLILARHMNEIKAFMENMTPTLDKLEQRVNSKIESEISELVGQAPDTLNTLQELSDALGDDPNFATTMTTNLGKKLDKTGGEITGDLTVSGTISGNVKGNVTGNVSGSSGSCTGNAKTATNVAWSGVTGKPTTLSGYGITDAPNKTGEGASGTWGIGISGNASTASKAAQLTTARTIDGVSFDGTSNIVHYGSCSTEAATVEKVVACSGFVLATGAKIAVKFTVTNTAANPTLNVNSTGAKDIYYRGAAISAGYLAANRTYDFIYNGTQYELIGDLDTNTNNATAQNISTANATYPILLGNTANATANIGNKAALFGSGVKVNPSTSSIVANGSVTSKGIIVSPQDAKNEGGQIDLLASKNTFNGISLDNFQGTFRIFGIASADGTSKTGIGTVFEIDPYTKAIKGGYTLTGNVTGSSGSCTGNAATATKATQDKNGKDIATTYLPLTGGTMSGNINMKKSASSVLLCNSDITKGTTPTADKWSGVYFTDGTVSTAGNHILGRVMCGVNKSGQSAMYINIYNPNADATNGAKTANVLSAFYPKDGTPYTSTITPAVGDNSTKIATTAYVVNKLKATNNVLNIPTSDTGGNIWIA